MVPRYLYIQYINYDNAEGVTSGANSLHSKTITARFGRNRTSVHYRNLHDQCFYRWVVLISVVAPLWRYLTPRRNRRMVMWSAVVCIDLPVMGDRSGEVKRVVMEQEIRDRTLSAQSAAHSGQQINLQFFRVQQIYKRSDASGACRLSTKGKDWLRCGLVNSERRLTIPTYGF